MPPPSIQSQQWKYSGNFDMCCSLRLAIVKVWHLFMMMNSIMSYEMHYINDHPQRYGPLHQCDRSWCNLASWMLYHCFNHWWVYLIEMWNEIHFCWKWSAGQSCSLKLSEFQQSSCWWGTVEMVIVNRSESGLTIPIYVNHLLLFFSGTWKMPDLRTTYCTRTVRNPNACAI